MTADIISKKEMVERSGGRIGGIIDFREGVQNGAEDLNGSRGRHRHPDLLADLFAVREWARAPGRRDAPIRRYHGDFKKYFRKIQLIGQRVKPSAGLQGRQKPIRGSFVTDRFSFY